MHVDVNLGERHLEKKQDDGINRGRNDVAIRFGDRVLHHAIANQASVDEDEDRVAIELLNFRTRDKTMQADFARFLSSLRVFVLRLAAPRRRLRKANMDERQQRTEGNELIERLLAEDLVDALRVIGHGRSDEHGVGGGVKLPVYFG